MSRCAFFGHRALPVWPSGTAHFRSGLPTCYDVWMLWGGSLSSAHQRYAVKASAQAEIMVSSHRDHSLNHPRAL